MKKVWMRCTPLLLLLSMLVNIAGCGGQKYQASDLMEGITAQPVEAKAAPETFEESQMAFALELFQKTVGASEEKNVLLSPLSVMLALSMTANGADGETKAQMEDVLGLPIEELNVYLYGYVRAITANASYMLNISNSIWFRNQLNVKKDFLQANADYYGADAFGSEFDNDTVQAMNKWVEEKTNGVIKNMVEKLEPQDVMCLINTILFEAKWTSAFESNRIGEQTFTPLVGSVQKVMTMSSDESRYIEDNMATGFIKPFKGDRYSMAILLPNKGVNVKDYIAQLTPEGLLGTLRNVKRTTVVTRLPKFSYEFSWNMNDVLKGMGMENAFGNTANFNKMAELQKGDYLYIGNVMHKTKIQVDELGTVAGASTSVSMQMESIIPNQKYVLVDRPFVYMIIDNNTNLPLFMGVVTSING